MDREITFYDKSLIKRTIVLSTNGVYRLKDYNGIRDPSKEEKETIDAALSGIKDSIINVPPDPYNSDEYKEGDSK